MSSRCKDKNDVQSKDTWKKFLLGPKVLRCKGKLLQGLRMRHVSDGLVERNMDLVLVQRHGYANVINKTHNVINKTHNGNFLQCKFNEPREGKIDNFSYLESLKKHKRRLQWGTFFEGSLVDSKKGVN
jgi:hypothetical protein